MDAGIIGRQGSGNSNLGQIGRSNFKFCRDALNPSKGWYLQYRVQKGLDVVLDIKHGTELHKSLYGTGLCDLFSKGLQGGTTEIFNQNVLGGS
eukprot:scaffold1465_cov179-Amphora_coffeaeformis.AAC.1